MENLFSSLEALSRLYEKIDTQVSDFARAACLACLPECQVCCETAKFVECSTLEMLPLSVHLWQEGKAESLLERLSRVESEDRCVLLARDPSPSFGGGCTYYPFRPLICRLFGFSAVRDKYGNPNMIMCKSLKALDSGLETRVNEMIQEGLQVPIAPQLSYRVAMIHPGLGQPLAPINVSLRTALEKVGYGLSLQTGSVAP